MAEISIKGGADLDAILKQLPANIEKNILRGAARAGQKEILKIAQGLVPVDDGDLKDSLRITTRARYGRVSATLVAGNAKAFYAHMVEFGTARHYIKPKNRKSLFFAALAREVVDHPGAAQKPFMRPALDAGTDAAVKGFADYVRRRIPAAAKKAGVTLPDIES